jgi:phosphohistidine swiveling domain-containing protein
VIGNQYRAAVASIGRGLVTGVVGQDIIVLPNMHPSHFEAVVAARGVVAEVGGQMAHLAVVSRELGKTLMVLPDACSLLQPGVRVQLDPARCEIRVIETETSSSK